jgi:DEAD/DEAH box helicase domain-containing protein
MMEEGRTPVVADRGMVRVCCSIDRARIGMDLPGSLRVAVSLDDGEEMLEDDWRAFLRGMNLFQFVEGASFFAVSGVESGEYEALRPVAAPFPVIEPDPGEARQWREAFDLLEYREGMWPVFEELRGAGWPAPSMGVDVAGESGAVLAQPEVAWPERRIALLTVEGAGDGPALEAAGWRVFQLEDIAGGGASPLLALHGEVDDR